MITEDYVSSELAKLLKEKGFYSEDCFAFYKKNREICFLQTFGDIADYDSGTCVIAPTLQMAMKWLREVHDIKIMIRPYVDGTYSYEILNGFWYVNFDSYEDAVEAAIKYCLENLI